MSNDTNPDILTAQYDFPLPKELIAQDPAPERPASRLFVFDRSKGTVRHARFSDLAGLEEFSGNTCLVLNSSRVQPRKLYCVKPSGGAAP